MNNRIPLLFIVWFLMLAFNCERENTIYFKFPTSEMILKIASVSPDGEYVIIDFCDLSDPRIEFRKFYHPVLQVVIGITDRKCWSLLDTTEFSDAWYFDWSHNSKNVIFSTSLDQPQDTFDLFPLYVYDIRTRTSSNLKRPWLSTSHYNIPLFSTKAHEIVFWSPRASVDTPIVSFISVGRVFEWDTLNKSISQIATSKDIAFADWMAPYDTTSLFIQANGGLWWLSRPTHELKNIVPQGRIMGKVGMFQDELALILRNAEGDRIEVYDLTSITPEYTINYSKGTPLSTAINRNSKIALETILKTHTWIFILSKDGLVLDSLKGNSPFWLAGTDSLVYSEEKRISLAYWRDGELKKEIILEVVK